MKREDGQSLVEFALVLPLFLILLLGMIDLGRMMHTYISLGQAGREAARTASIGKTDEQIIRSVYQSAAGLDEAKLQIQIIPEHRRIQGDTVQITLEYSVDFLTPMLKDMAPSFKLTDTTVMRVE